MTTSLFVGRERELARLREVFDAACDGEPRVVMLAGEPGIGKTRLAEELTEYASGHASSQGALVLWGRAQEFAGTPPYWPWVQIGRAYRTATPEETRRAEWAPYAEELQRIFPGLRELFPDLSEPGPAESPEAQFRLFDAMGGFLHLVSGRVPLLLVLDDLHWADRSTLLVLGHVARDLAGARLLILGAYRDTDLDRTHPLAEVLAELNRERLFERLHLSGLSEDDVTAFVRTAADAEPRAELLARIYEETEGNPFFLSEVVALLDAEGRLAGGDGTVEIAVPEGVREVLGRRLNRLSPETIALLTLAAVVGREFDEPLLGALTDNDGPVVSDLLGEALRARIVEETGAAGVYRFTHALMRETLLAELPASHRVRLHGQIAETLEHLAGETSAERIEELAAHYAESAVLDREHAEKAAHYLRLAAEQAQSQLAWREAAAHYERCLELVTAHEDRLGLDEAALWLELGVCQLADGRFHYDAEACDRAIELWPDGDPLGLARGLLRIFAPNPVPPTIQRSMPVLDRVVAALGASPLPETCALLAWKATALRGAEGDAAWERAHAMAQALGLEGERYPPVLRIHPAQVAVDSGRFADATAAFEQLEADVPELAGVGREALLTFLAGNLTGAEVAARRTATLHRERGRRHLEQFNIARLAQIAWRRGDLAAMERLLEDVPPSLGSIWVVQRPEVALVRGAFDRAVAELPDLHRAPSEAYIRAEWLSIWCRVQASTGELDAARATFLEWAETYEHLDDFGVIGFIEAIQSMDDVVCEFADESLLRRILGSLHPLTELRNWWFGSSPDYLRGAIELRLGDPDAAQGWFETGLEWATRERVPLVAGRCHQGLAQVAERRGDHASAREHLDAAVEYFTPIGAKLYLDQVQAALEALREPASSRPRFPDGLTEREVEVLRLVASGNSNREIAEKLVLSLRTVERHITNIYGKIGARGRADATAYALRHSLD